MLRHKRIIGVEDHFDASHFLMNYEGNCANLHGHTWHVMLEVEGDVKESVGMVIDLRDLKKALKDVISEYDHKNINNITDAQPSCEVLLGLLRRELEDHPLLENVMIRNLKLREGEGGWARWTAY